MLKPASSSSSRHVHRQQHADLPGLRAGAPHEQALLERGREHGRHDVGRAVEGHEGLHGADAREPRHGARQAPAQGFEAALDALAEQRDAPLGAEVALGFEPLDDARADRHADGGAGVGPGDESRARVVGAREEHGAALQRLARGDDIDPLVEREGAEREQLAGAREGLHLVDPDRHAGLAAALHQRREELPRRGVEAAFALHELEEHRGDAAREAREVRVERVDALACRVRIVRVVERNVQHVPAQRQALAIGRLVGELGERERAAREAALEDDDVIGRRVLLEHDLERVLVGDRARDREPDVLQALAGVAQQRARDAQILGARVEMALEDGVRGGRDDGGLEQIRIRVAERVDADPADEIELLRAVGEPHARAAAVAAEQDAGRSAVGRAPARARAGRARRPSG